MTTGVCDAGFELDAMGAVLEDVDGEGVDPTDLDGETPVTTELGCGQNTMFGSKHYGADWEGH